MVQAIYQWSMVAKALTSKGTKGCRVYTNKDEPLLIASQATHTGLGTRSGYTSQVAHR